MTVVYDWRSNRTTISSSANTDILTAVSGDFSVIANVVIQPYVGAAGIKLHGVDSDFYFHVGLDDLLGPLRVQQVSPLPIALLVEWVAVDQRPYCYYSTDNDLNWIPVEHDITLAQPTTAGVFMTTPTGDLQEAAFTFIRTVAGRWQPTDPEDMRIIRRFTITLPWLTPPTQPPALTPSQENVVHALVGTQFGDLEFDVGKSVRWTQWFTDDVFVTDINLGMQRYWVINWSASFPEVNYKVTGINFFEDPVAFRKQQWSDAVTFAAQNPQALVFDWDDWVIFVDGHEGLSADNRSLPDDYLVEPFRSYVYREIARANAAGRDRIVIPFFVYLRHDHVQNARYDAHTEDRDGNPQTFYVEQSVGAPYYLPYLGMTRMFKVSVLQDPNFDWTLIDRPVAIPDANVKIQLVSYGYAHWNLQDIEPPQTEVPALSAQNDDGWRQRCLLSGIRAIPGIPTGDPQNPVGTWQPPANDPVGKRGPWAFDTYSDRNLTGVVIPNPPPAVAAETAGVRVPLYDLVYRFNMRDGVWYEEGATGAIPLVWNPDTAKWEPVVPVKEWQAV